MSRLELQQQYLFIACFLLGSIATAPAPLREQLLSEGYVGPFDTTWASQLSSRYEKEKAMNQLIVGTYRQLRAYKEAVTKKDFQGFVEKYGYWPLQIWEKACHASDSTCREIALDPAVIENVQGALGTKDIVLIASHPAVKVPGSHHRWHADANAHEYGDDGVIVWFSLGNINPQSHLAIVTKSHLVDARLQDELHAKLGLNADFGREHLTPREAFEEGVRLVNYAKNEHGVDAEFVSLENMAFGSFAIMHSKAWHSTINFSRKPRAAFVATFMRRNARPVRPPAQMQSTAMIDGPKLQILPPVIPILAVPTARIGRGGKVNHGERALAAKCQLHDGIVNYFHPDSSCPVHVGSTARPSFKSDTPKSHYPFSDCADQFESSSSEYEFCGLLETRTSILSKLEVHWSQISPGFYPHLPHSHSDEEILLNLKGINKAHRIPGVTFPFGPYYQYSSEHLVPDTSGFAPEEFLLLPGDAVFYPQQSNHTITAVDPMSDLGSIYGNHKPLDASIHRKATYLNIRFQGKSLLSAEKKCAWPVTFLSRPVTSTRLLRTCTRTLSQVEMHSTHWAPGEGYAPHADQDHDVLVIVLQGKILLSPGETTLVEGDVVFLPVGTEFALHGMRNIGETPSMHYAIEFYA